MINQPRSPHRVSPPRRNRGGLGSVNQRSPSLVQHGNDMSAGAATTFPSVKLTLAEFAAAVADRERARRDGRSARRSGRQRPDDCGLTRACIEALRSTGQRFPRIPSLRVVRAWSPNGTPLPKDWSVLIERDETPLALASLPAPFVGFVAVVAGTANLPKRMLEARRRLLDDPRFRVVPVEVESTRRWERNGSANDCEMDDHSAMLLLVDELATLAADLWFVGKLDRLLTEQEPDHVGDE